MWKVLARVMLRRSGRYANKRPDALEEDQLARILRNGALAIRHQAVMSPTWGDDPHHHNAVAVLRCFWSRAALVEGHGRLTVLRSAPPTRGKWVEGRGSWPSPL